MLRYVRHNYCKNGEEVMGTSFCGVVIQTDTKDLDFMSVLTNLFNKEFIPIEKHCDCRDEDCFFIAKTDKYLIVSNSKFVDEILQNNSSYNMDMIQKTFVPKFVFVFEEYDSGGTYSFAVILDKKIVRKFRSITYEITVDEGELYEIESKWRSLPTKFMNDEDYEHEKVYFHPDSETEFYTEESLPQLILHELMNDKIGFDVHTLDEHIIDSGFFKYKNNDFIGKKWWQVWK